MTDKKEMTIDDLAAMMKTEFDNTQELISDTQGLVKLTRAEMAKDEDLQEIKQTVNYLYEMLDDEARFIQQMRGEYPLFVKRLERIEKKLGLPHRIGNDD